MWIVVALVHDGAVPVVAVADVDAALVVAAVVVAVAVAAPPAADGLVDIPQLTMQQPTPFVEHKNHQPRYAGIPAASPASCYTRPHVMLGS